MRFRNSRLRTKVTALLVSLTALWAFAAWVTLREGVNLLWVSTLDKGIAQPSDPLLVELQRERRLSAIWLGNPGDQQRADLDVQRIRTDRTKATLERLARGGDVKRAADPVLEKRVADMLNRLSDLDAGRQAIDTGSADRNQAIVLYTGVIDSVFRTYDSIVLDDKKVAGDTRTLIAINRTWDILSQEDALLAGALSAGKLNITEYRQFTQIVGVRRFNTAQAMVELQQVDRVAYEQLIKSEKLSHLQSMEDQIIQKSRVESRMPVSAEKWHAVTEPTLAEVRQTVQAAGDRLVARAKPVAMGTIVRLALAGGLGLLAVIASIIVSITTARALLQQLERLRGAAWELADKRLPSVVERLGRGEEVDVAVEAPPLEFGGDEIGQVGQAFNAVQKTAIQVAVEQAELRRGIRDVLLSLARRTQTLVRRQLTLLDVMERREFDPTELEDLFRVDHLATRMRRNAENLIVLSGATPARGWRRSVPMIDVLRAAVAEVEDYSRVNVLPVGSLTLAGRAVGDVTHLLAELIENAVSFSPSYTIVQVGGHMAASGYAIEVEDRGLGMSDESLEAANQQIAHSPEFKLSSTARLGLYVVSRLANRYGIRVSLKHSVYGGTTAVILLPRDLVIENAEPDEAADALSDVPPDVTVGAAADGESIRATAHDGSPESVGAWAGGSRAPAVFTVPEQRTDPGPGVVDRPGVVDGNDAVSQRSEISQPENNLSAPEVKRTPSGLPVRVPQASLAPPLRTDDPRSAALPDDEEDLGRSPEEIRKVMGSYQTGTQRGRSAVAKSLGEGARRPTTAPTPPSADDEPPPRPGNRL